MNLIPLNTSNVLLYATLVIIVAILWIFFKRKHHEVNYKLKPFLSNNEKKCFNYLLSIYPEYYIAPQVSMGALLEPIKDKNAYYQKGQQNYDSLRNAIKSNRIDFLLLDKNFNPLFVIELDDASHNDKVEQDKKRDQNLLDAGIPTLRFRNNKGSFPTRKELDNLLDRYK